MQHLEGHVSIDGAGVGHAHVDCYLMQILRQRSHLCQQADEKIIRVLHWNALNKELEKMQILQRLVDFLFSLLSLDECHSSTFSNNQGTTQEDWEILVYVVLVFAPSYWPAKLAETPKSDLCECVCVCGGDSPDKLRLRVIITHHGLVVDLLHEMSQHQEALQGGVHAESLRQDWEL